MEKGAKDKYAIFPCLKKTISLPPTDSYNNLHFLSNLWRFLLFVHATWLFKHTGIYIHSRYSTDWTNFLYYIESYYMWCKIFRLLLCLLNCPTHSKREQTEMTQIRMILTFSPRFQSSKCIWKWIMLHKRKWLALITYLIMKINICLRISKNFEKISKR